MRNAVGRLSDRPLIAVVRAIYRALRSGELRLEGEGRSQRFHFQYGQLYLPPGHELAAAAAATPPRSLARLLAQEWSGWTDGSYEFVEGQERGDGWVGPLATAHVLMEEAVAGKDDFQLLRQLGGQDCEFVAVAPERQAGLALDTHEAFFLSRLERSVSVKELLRQVELEQSAALVRLCRLQAAELIRPSSEVEEAKPQAAVNRRLMERLGERIRLELVRKPLEISPQEHRGKLKELFERLGELNHYELLGVGFGATNEEIHDAYMRLARLVHPAHSRRLGLVGREGGLELLFERATDAYLTLSDPDRTRAYLDRMGSAEVSERMGPSTDERRRELRELAAQKYKLATSYAAREEFHFAVQLLEHAVEVDPKPEYFALLGQCQENNPRWLDRALESYSQAVQLSRADPELRCRLAGCYEKLGRVERAREEYEAALERMPGFPDAQAGLQRLMRPDRPAFGEGGAGWLERLLAWFRLG